MLVVAAGAADLEKSSPPHESSSKVPRQKPGNERERWRLMLIN